MNTEDLLRQFERKINYKVKNVWPSISQSDVDCFLSNFNGEEKLV